MQPGYKIGTCSWNFDGWVGLVYSAPRRRAVEYLPEYAERFTTAEIDSWFYRIPDRQSVREYAAAVPPEFSFTCKVPQEITLTHHRRKQRGEPLQPNPEFLSVERFMRFLDAIEPLLPQLDAIMFEFEYLNHIKMPGLSAFMDQLGRFLDAIPAGVPYAVEPRNANYLGEEWFSFLLEHRAAHVFSQKLYMPDVWEVYRKHRGIVDRMGRTVIRLLGGDRAAIEARTGKAWDSVVEPRPAEKEQIAGMVATMIGSLFAIMSVNNHFEGSAPATVTDLQRLIEARSG